MYTDKKSSFKSKPHIRGRGIQNPLFASLSSSVSIRVIRGFASLTWP